MRDPLSAWYIAALTLLISVPLLLGANELFTIQQNAVLGTQRKIESLTLARDVRAILDVLRPLMERRNVNASLDPAARTAMTAAVLKLDTDAYGKGAFFGTDDAMQQLDHAWAAAVASDGAGYHFVEMQTDLAAVSRQVANASRSAAGVGDAAESLLDAYVVAIPQTGALVARGSASRARDAFHEITDDFGRAMSALPPEANVAASLQQTQDAIDALAESRPADAAPNADAQKSMAQILAQLRALEDVAGDNAGRLFDARLAGQQRLLIAIVGFTAMVVIFAVGLAVLLGRTVVAKNMRDFVHLREERDRERAELESERMRNALAKSEARFAAVFDRASLGVAVLDLDGHVARKNDALEQMFPHASAHDLGARFPEFDRLVRGQIPSFGYEIDASTPERTVFLDISVSLVNDDAGETSFALSIAKDITERRVTQERLLRDSRYDALVELPNRNFLFERMEEMMLHKLATDRPRGVLFIDVDGFKVVNDSLGHEVGDHVLVAAARRLESAIGPLDFVARFGGDEFVAIIEGRGTRQDLIDVANRITSSLNEPFEVGGREIYVSASSGLAVCDRPYETVGSIVRDADTAMYHAKASNRAAVAVFDSTMREASTRRLVLAAQLRRALERDQLHLVYQPVVEIATSRVSSLEVLLRWEHPTLGSVPPSEFIPVAEDIGLIVPFGRFVLERACAQLGAWREGSHDLDDVHIAVNASARELLQGDYCEFVESMVERYGLRAGDLTLEVTESTVLQSDRYAEGTLDRLKSAGVKLSIDDFGTGYSSLRYLQSFPFDQLKIDGSFVRGKGEALASQAIVSMLLALGRSFDVTVVAEGVETHEQLSDLYALGCEYAQGFLLERPQPASAIPQSVRRLLGLALVDESASKGSLATSRIRKAAHR